MLTQVAFVAAAGFGLADAEEGEEYGIAANDDDGEPAFAALQNVSDFSVPPTWKYQGARMVVMEMSLAFFSILFNLVVLISIRERESLLNSTVNVVLANLCAANLVSAVFVKSIAVVFNGYAVARTLWEVELAFCTVHTVSFRATWAVFPYSIVVLCWHGLAQRAEQVFHRSGNESVESCEDLSALPGIGMRTATIAVIEKQPSIEAPNNSEEVVSTISGVIVKQNSSETHPPPADQSTSHDEEDDDYVAGLTARQKSALGFIWFMSAVYAIMTDQVLSKQRFVPCSVRQELSDRFNFISLIAVVAVPLLFGPLLCPLAHLVLSFCTCCCHKCLASADNQRDNKLHQTDTSSPGSSHPILDFLLLSTLSVVFVVTYVTHMYLVEVYFATSHTHFHFMALKYCFGCLNLVLIPLAIIVLKPDIRRAAIDVYCKRSATQGESAEMTFEQLQKQVGIGVNID